MTQEQATMWLLGVVLGAGAGSWVGALVTVSWLRHVYGLNQVKDDAATARRLAEEALSAVQGLGERLAAASTPRTPTAVAVSPAQAPAERPTTSVAPSAFGWGDAA